MIVLNWTLESIITIISGIPLLIGAGFLFNQYLTNRDRILLLLTSTWLIHIVYMTSFGFAYLFEVRQILQYNSILLVLNLYLLTILFDYMNNESLSPVKTMIVTVIAVLLVIYAFRDNAVRDFIWQNGDLSYTTQGTYRTMTAIAAGYLGAIYIYYAAKIYVHVPPHLKGWALLNLVGVIIFSEIVVIFFALGITRVIPGIAILLSALGGAFSIYAFIQSPQLIYVLPFTSYRLIVIDALSGTSLYSYDWIDDEQPQISPDFSIDLVTSALSGLNAFATEAIQKGSIREIRLKKRYSTSKLCLPTTSNSY